MVSYQCFASVSKSSLNLCDRVVVRPCESVTTMASGENSNNCSNSACSWEDGGFCGASLIVFRWHTGNPMLLSERMLQHWSSGSMTVFKSIV